MNFSRDVHLFIYSNVNGVARWLNLEFLALWNFFALQKRTSALSNDPYLDLITREIRFMQT